MTKLEALNQILNIIVESEKEGRTILEAINLTAKAYGGKGDSTNNAVAIKELYDIFTETKTQLTPANIKKGKTVLGVKGDYWEIEVNSNTSVLSKITKINPQMFNNLQLIDKDTERFFCGLSALTSLDLSNFDTSKVTSMYSMFDYCYRLTSLTLGPNWASNNRITSFDLSSCPLTKESVLDVLNKLADRTATTDKPTLKLKSTVKALLSDDEIKIATDKGWTVA